MSLEQDIDTSPMFEKTPIPDGEHEFQVELVERVEKVKGMYEWTVVNKEGETYLHSMFANEMGDLLRILGCKETAKNKFTFDTIDLKGKWFKTTVSHFPDKNKPNVIRQKMSEFRKSEQDEDIQF